MATNLKTSPMVCFLNIAKLIGSLEVCLLDQITLRCPLTAGTCLTIGLENVQLACTEEGPEMGIHSTAIKLCHANYRGL